MAIFYTHSNQLGEDGVPRRRPTKCFTHSIDQRNYKTITVLVDYSSSFLFGCYCGYAWMQMSSMIKVRGWKKYDTSVIE